MVCSQVRDHEAKDFKKVSCEIMNMRLVVTFAAAFVHTSSSQKVVDSLAAVGESTPTPQPVLPLVKEPFEITHGPPFNLASESNHQSFLPDDWHTIAHQQWAERRSKARNQTRTRRGIEDYLPPFCTLLFEFSM